jgi:hypothetical protein
MKEELMIHTSEWELAKLILFSLGVGHCMSIVGSLLWFVHYNDAQGRCWSAAMELGLLYEHTSKHMCVPTKFEFLILRFWCDIPLIFKGSNCRGVFIFPYTYDPITALIRTSVEGYLTKKPTLVVSCLSIMASCFCWLFFNFCYFFTSCNFCKLFFIVERGKVSCF